MDVAAAWKRYFEAWPHEVGHAGVLVTAFGEQIPFENFMIGDDLLLVDRRAPDTMGARKVLMPFGQILAVKITEPIKSRVFMSAGFQPPTSERRN